MPLEVLEYKDVPLAMVKKIIEEEKNKGVELPELVKLFEEYIDKVNKCDVERIEELYSKLKELGFRSETVAMMINIRPRILDELRILLVFEPTVPDEDVLKKVLELLDEYCPLTGG